MENRAGNASIYARVRSTAIDLLEASGKTRYLGDCWHIDFIKRHQVIKSTFAYKVEYSRIKLCNKAAISAFFERYDSIMKEFKIASSNI
jgi:hypothetical protein